LRRFAYFTPCTIRNRNDKGEPMNRNDNETRDRRSTPSDRQPNWTSALVLAFGLLALAFLVAIDRPGWWQIKPATGTAAAMSYAAEKPSRG
jgi:hypothetical protein